MLSRKEYEERETKLLAPFAAKALESQGREYPEEECPFRTIFQRDRDRIIHSAAFRRLEYKTQVFVNHEGDYYRTRLTHTLEVAQISRGISRTLRLNEDLAEAIALCHDLGHTPFGHAGEEVMDRLMKDFGDFEHNRQSFRVVTFLERRYPEFSGLNLSFEVLEGIVKHSGEFDNPAVEGFRHTGYPTLEAQIVNIADEIAYLNHDLDDGLQSQLLTMEQLDGVDLWHDVVSGVRKDYPKADDNMLRYQTIRRLIHLFVTDVQEETKRQIADRKIESLEDVRAKGKDLIAFSQKLGPRVRELKAFLRTNLYKHWRVQRMTAKAQKIIEDLFTVYKTNPGILPTEIQERIRKDTMLERHICDTIAEMTDRFALEEHAKLFDPHEKV